MVTENTNIKSGRIHEKRFYRKEVEIVLNVHLQDSESKNS